MPTLLVIGATSDIAHAAALLFGQKGWDLILAGRDMERLEDISFNLRVRLAKDVPFYHYDVLDSHKRTELWDNLDPKPEAILIAVGLLGDQGEAKSCPELALKVATVNFTGLIPIIIQASQYYESIGKGSVIGISSVAGDRGRASNYPYGSAKAGFSAYLSGLRNSLSKKGVQVLTIKPGYVRTAMTANMLLPGLLTATPEQVAKCIYKGVVKKKSVVYVKWFWRWIMFVIKSIPEFIFKRTNS
ncbi:MAG: SDR family oxidoreductase [Deltaproteobacteria bacterium]|nr:SDR family oxidoreductase [Deltaproteobacteria bacterium]